MWAAVVVSCVAASASALVREVDADPCENLTATFPAVLDGQECWGLVPNETSPMGNPITTVQECANLCCSDPLCTLYNFNTTTKATAAAAAAAATTNTKVVALASIASRTEGSTVRCWTGTQKTSAYTCRPVEGWVGRGGRGQPPPPPPPAPCPSPPNGSIGLCIRAMPQVSALPFSPNVNATLGTVSADSLSLYKQMPTNLPRGGVLTRWFPVSGEIHLARVPQSEWYEQLLRMRGGGLDMIAVYVFWIHHEEVQGTFNFTGRRDVRLFLQLASKVGLHVLLRVGPWDHGECRNGGHPDWVLESGKCGALRSTDPKYLACTQNWYTALSQQVQGLFHRDGGPITLVQVDNETGDWKYLLALRDLAVEVGITPAFFAKTGWPEPSAGYPDDYPMLPFFGGYADLFWTNEMAPQPSKGRYVFNLAGPTATVDTDRVSWAVPAGYPKLGVEIGGGMAAAYNHRVHMFSEDMPSMHLVDVGNGFNMLGFYMYHGGNNPHSLLPYASDERDQPANTLQESSFQPAGAANPMPSESYDFFAPLGEFGQPRRHYHQMRRLHNMIKGWGPLLAGTSQDLPIIQAQPDDNATVRWAVRSNNNSEGFVFVNNYQRLSTQEAKSGVRLHIQMLNGSGAVSIPSLHSEPLAIASGLWFHLPLNIPLVKAKPPIAIAWATAQLLARIETYLTEENIFFLEIDGVVPEVAISGLSNASQLVITGGSNASVTAEAGEGTAPDVLVIRSMVAGTSSFAEIHDGSGNVVARLILLPWNNADRSWVAPGLGPNCGAVSSSMSRTGCSSLLISEPIKASSYRAMLLTSQDDACTVHVRTTNLETDFLMFPASQGATSMDGLFAKYHVNTTQEVLGGSLPAPTFELVAVPGPARAIPLNSVTGKAQEPTADDWAAAAEYRVTFPTFPSSLSGNNTDLVLAIDYRGDAARVFFGDRLLTDNWFSGYPYPNGEGALEVGITYLAQENPGLLASQAELRILILPLKQETLDPAVQEGGKVFLQQDFWPIFDGNSSNATAMGIDALRWIVTARTAVKVC